MKILYDIASAPKGKDLAFILHLFNDFDILIFDSSFGGEKPVLIMDDEVKEIMWFDLCDPMQLKEYKELQNKILNEKSESKRDYKELG